DPEGRATGGALRDGAGAVRPSGAVVDGLPHIGLQRCDAFAARETAEVNGVGLVGGQAVVATVGVAGRDLLPRGAPVGRRVRDRTATWRRVVELAEMVGHDRRLAAVRPDVGDAIPRRGRGQDAGRQTDGSTYDRCNAQHRGDSTWNV